MVLAIAACGGGSATPGEDAPDPDGPGNDGQPGDGPPTTGDAPPDPCAPGTWCVEDPPAAGILLRAVWAADLDNVFVVGDGGAILHRRNNAWTAMPSGTTKDLTGIYGISATDIWAAGVDGTVLHFDGSAWAPEGSLSNDFTAVWAAASDDVYFTSAGNVTHWNGQQFTSTPLPGAVFSISGAGPTDIWATGEQAKIDHYTGTWTTGITPTGETSSTYFSVYAMPGETWVSGFAETYRFANNAWTTKPAPGTVFQSFHGVSSTSIWGAGGNDVGHYDGASWSVESPAGAGASMFGMGGVGGSFWIVGNDSLILHRVER